VRQKKEEEKEEFNEKRKLVRSDYKIFYSIHVFGVFQYCKLQISAKDFLLKRGFFLITLQAIT